MEITEQALIEEFDRRDIPLSKRVLTDWRAKGYLPRLHGKGKGQGKGKIYFWSDPQVIERAFLVDEALQLSYRGRKILVILWLFGYDIPSAVIREHLLEGIGTFLKMARGEKQDRVAVEEHIDDLTAKYYKIASKYPQLELSQDAPPAAMEMVLNIFVNPWYDLTDGPFEDGLAATLEAQSKRQSEAAARFKKVSAGDRVRNTEALLRLVHEHFSLNHMRTALIDATEVQMQRVQTDITTLFSFVSRISANEPEIEKLSELRAFVAYSLGPLLAVVGITLRYQGLGQLIDEALSRLAAQSMNDAPRA